MNVVEGTSLWWWNIEAHLFEVTDNRRRNHNITLLFLPQKLNGLVP
jgi:hypothetical protein